MKNVLSTVGNGIADVVTSAKTGLFGGKAAGGAQAFSFS